MTRGLITNLDRPAKSQKGWPWTEESVCSVYSNTEEYPLISVVTISYNQGHFIEETIRSILLQNYPNLEYIIIDGGSTDNTIEIIKKYEKYLHYWISEPDSGPANALNKGFAKATGEIFYYINSDDLLMPDTFSNVVNYIKSNPNYDVYYGHGYMSFGGLAEKFKIYSDRFNLNNYRLGSVSVVQQSTFIRSKIFNNSGGFNENNKTNWDGELLVDLSMVGAKFKRYTLHTGFFRIHDTSISGGMGDQKLYKENINQINNRIQSKNNFKDTSTLNLLLNKLITDPFLIFGRLIVKIRLALLKQK